MADIEITYNGVDVSDEVEVARCVHQTHAWGAADWLDIEFADSDALWDAWGPAAGDVVSAACGTASTGAMHVRRVARRDGRVAMRAYAMPAAMFGPRLRSWDSVRLLQLVAQLAGECGMAWAAAGVADRRYGQVDQPNVASSAFLARRLSLEGASLMAFGGRLTAVSCSSMQELSPSVALVVESGSDYETRDIGPAAWGACTVRCGRHSGTFRAGEGPGRTVELPYAATGDAEAARWAAGLLRRANREARTMTLRDAPFSGRLTGGCTARIECEDAPSWDGVHVAAMVRHDYVAESTTARLSRFLEGY